MIDRTLLIVGWMFVIGFLVQAIPFSALAIDIDGVVIEGDQVLVSRDFPTDTIGVDRPWISYIETVRPLTPGHNGGQICEQRGGPFKYTSTDTVGRWSIDWAEDCLNDPLGFTWTASWTWWVGAIPVGPTQYEVRILRDPCQYRISSNNVIHGPESKHWAQTSTDMCFATRAQAEEYLGEN